MLFFEEIGPITGFDCGKFSFEYWDEEIPRTASWFQETGVNSLRFTLYKVEHGVDHPGGRENFAVVNHALSGANLIHVSRLPRRSDMNLSQAHVWSPLYSWKREGGDVDEHRLHINQ